MGMKQTDWVFSPKVHVRYIFAFKIFKGILKVTTKKEKKVKYI